MTFDECVSNTLDMSRRGTDEFVRRSGLSKLKLRIRSAFVGDQTGGFEMASCHCRLIQRHQFFGLRNPEKPPALTILGPPSGLNLGASIQFSIAGQMALSSLHIVALVSAQRLEVVREAVGSYGLLIHANTIQAAAQHCTSEQPDVLVCDLTKLGTEPEGAYRHLRFLEHCGMSPSVVLVPDDLLGMRTTLRLASRGAQFELALLRLSGRAEGLREAILQAAQSRPSDIASDALLRRLPNPSLQIKRLIRDIFRCPSEYRLSNTVFDRLSTTPQSLNDHLRSSGLRSWTHIRRAARVIQSYHLMRRFSLTPTRVVKRLGWGSYDTFSRDVWEVAHQTPGRLSWMDPRDIMGIAADYCILPRVDADLPAGCPPSLAGD